VARHRPHAGHAISTRDILLVQGGVLVVAASYVLFNLVTDLLQVALDPGGCDVQ
jgi:peptide/nickel transport system permease protein